MACKIIKQKTNNMNIIKRNEEPRKYQWTKGKRENNKVSHEMKKMRDKRGSRLIYDPSFFIGGISAWVQSRFSMNAGFSKLRPWYSGVLAFSFFLRSSSLLIIMAWLTFSFQSPIEFEWKSKTVSVSLLLSCFAWISSSQINGSKDWAHRSYTPGWWAYWLAAQRRAKPETERNELAQQRELENTQN